MLSLKLSFMHITEKVSKANSILGLIKRNFGFLSANVFLLFYKSLVRSHLEYAVFVWMPYEKNKIESLEQIQKRATKLVKKCKHLSYEKRLRYLELPSLMYRRVRGDMIQVFKLLCMNEGMNEFIPVFHKPSCIYTRGHKYKLVKSPFKLIVRKFYFTNRVVDLWNELPEGVVMCKSVIVFEKCLDEYLCRVSWRYDYETFIY